MADIVGWFTMNGAHIPIMKGQSKEEASKKYFSSKHGKTISTLVTKNKKEQHDIEEKENFVKSSMSNKVKTFEREKSTNLDEVKKRGGVNDEDAKAAVSQAEKVFAKASAEEPQITKDIISSAEAVKGTMYGLDFRLKQPTSMAGKIASDSKEDNVSFEKSASSIKDAIRYTTILDEKSFTSGYNSMKQSLESKGYKELRCKNFYDMYKNGNSQQKAVQCVFENSKGQTFELQFHTVKSQGVKELLHPLYEEYRRSSTSDGRKTQLDKQMKHLSSYVSDPTGVYNINSHS